MGRCGVVLDLGQAQLVHVFMRQPGVVPAADVFECGGQRPARLPAQAGTGFGDVELEVIGLVRVIATVLLPACAVAPTVDHVLNNPLHRAGIVVLGAEVPAFCKGLALGVEVFGQGEVAA